MAGSNPYLKDKPPAGPKKKYLLTLLNENKAIEVDPAKIPYGETGNPGSILDVLMAHGISIDHACGGVCACATCHVYVKEGLDACSPATDSEQDMVDLAPDLRPYSRLSCQVVPTGEKDISVEIPSWNRNLTREGH